MTLNEDAQMHEDFSGHRISIDIMVKRKSHIEGANQKK